MPIKTEMDVSRNLTVHTVSGDVTFQEIVETLKGFWEGPSLTMKVIWDGRGATLRNISASQLLTLPYYTGSYLLERRRGGKTAIVAPEKLEYGQSRSIQAGERAIDLPWELRIFGSMAEALEWMNGRRSADSEQ